MTGQNWSQGYNPRHLDHSIGLWLVSDLGVHVSSTDVPSLLDLVPTPQPLCDPLMEP